MTFIVHYDEIGLKGNNRVYFEKLLIHNIQSKLGEVRYEREPGLISLEKGDPDVLSKIPGIAYFSQAERCELDIEKITKLALQLLKKKKFETFKIDTQRRDKHFELNSVQVNEIVGEAVVNKLKKKVKLKDPDMTLKIEITRKNAYLSTEDIPGVNGLPTNTKQKVVALLSGGFDSPVAAYLMMKRGCEVILVHFHNKNQASQSVKDKITKLAEQLSKFQVNTKLYIVPFDKIQQELITKVQSTSRMLVYRRFMLKISSKIADLEKAKFLVVGDSLSQVASQTFQNLYSTYKNTDKHIFSPLIGLDKKEIINISKQIGTHDISTLPGSDCCTYFLPKHPELKSSPGFLRKIEDLFDDKLIEDAVQDSKTYEF